MFDANNSVFVIDGKVTNIALENCKNVELKNLEIRHVAPDMHELKVVDKRLCSVDFEIDAESRYMVENKELVFLGKDYKAVSDKKAKRANWIGLILEETPEKIERVLHPLHKNIKIIGNEFKDFSGFCVSAKSTDEITDEILMKGNKLPGDKKIKAKNCNNFQLTE